MTKVRSLIVKSFIPLYSLNTNGTIQKWHITVNGDMIFKEYGQEGGSMQIVAETITKGKNIGKANQTTPAQQALLEATAQWEKKLKSGYTKTKKEAKAGAVDTTFVTGGIDPMLAHKFRDHESKITLPCHTQPKLDGIRCIAIINKGVATLWSRTRKPITGVPHIVKALEQQFLKHKNQIVLDGELYNHAYKNKFEEIVSFVKQITPKKGHEVVQYHIYDIAQTSLVFSLRSTEIRNQNFKSPLIEVHTRVCYNAKQVMDYFDQDLVAGYEGTMARNSNSLYENKRSYHLQKIKEFDDSEFKIIGVKGGRGRMAECAIFTCETPKGDFFDCKMEGSLSRLKEIFLNTSSVIGKMLTVRYQGKTNGNLPRFPIGVTIKDGNL